MDNRICFNSKCKTPNITYFNKKDAHYCWFKYMNNKWLCRKCARSLLWGGV